MQFSPLSRKLPLHIWANFALVENNCQQTAVGRATAIAHVRNKFSVLFERVCEQRAVVVCAGEGLSIKCVEATTIQNA